MEGKFTVYLFNSTHWDREWYQYFQGFRWRLVDFCDDMMDKLDKYSEFGTFTFDGQTVVLEDYLEICPENKERLGKYIKEGKILIGPWYVMPDEFLVSGESLIHNMLMGTKIARDFDVEPMRFGYICDIFGHAAQTPQIFNGFGIKGALLGRGTTEETTPAFFNWQSPDGSFCTTFKLADRLGYCDGKLLALKYDDHEVTPEMEQELVAYIEKERSRSEVPVVIFMDGDDHGRCHADGLLKIKAVLEKYYPDVTVKIASLEEMTKEVNAFAESLPTKVGELNEPAQKLHIYNHLITYTLSSRYDLKKANDAGQTLMEKWAGPLTVLSAAGKQPLRKAYYDLAYKYLIRNHPHDSICGCSIDQVHRDMHYRFDQVQELCNEINQYGLEGITGKALEGYGEADDCRNKLLTIMNPLPYRRKEAVTVDIWFERDYPYRYSEPFGYEDKNAFYIIDQKGEQVPYKLIGINRNKKAILAGRHVNGDRHTVVFEADLAAGGITQYAIVPAHGAVRYFDTLRTGTYTAENELVKLAVQPDGTLQITDKRTGQCYTNQLTYEDNGEIGDGWWHCAPTCDSKVLSGGCPTVISVSCDSPAKCTFTIEKRMFVPRRIERVHEMNPDIRRSTEYVEITLKADVSITKSSPMIRVALTVDNQATDHRLRLIIPTGITEDRYVASEAFCTVERKVSIKKESEMWREAGSHEKAMTSFAYKQEGNRGLAFISGGGLHEIGTFDDEEGTLAVTLMRCFGRAEPAQVTVDGQVLGKYQYSFGLLPMVASDTDADLQKLSDALATGIQYRNDTVSAVTGTEHSFFEVSSRDGNICYSTMKPAEAKDGTILRIYNMSGAEDVAEITLDRVVTKAVLTDLEENVLSDEEQRRVTVKNEKISITVAPWKIVTVKVV